ncbi:outer membrane autotransporter barrel domain-containing protein [Acetobacter sp. CAG:267]|nr:outer membrane autotransporter barrel domain-containing protein [Acetobacter sp. CAG:267]
MKNKLLITTALVALVSANNAFAQVREDLIVDSQTPISNQGMDEEPYYYKSIKVEKEGSLNIETSNIKTEQDITVLGGLDLKNSVLEAGNDADDQPNNSNILLDGATVTMNDSDLEANGNITIKDTNLSSISSTEAPDNYGVWADGNLTLENSEVTLKDSYLSAAGEIIIDGGSYTSDGGTVLSEHGSITIKNGTITDTEFMAQNGNVNLEGGTIQEIKDAFEEKEPSGEIGIKNLNIKGGEFIHTNVSSDGFENLNVSGGKMQLTNTEMNAWDGNINISGGEINLMGDDTSVETGLYARKEFNITGGTINMKGTDTILNNIADYKPDDYPAYDLNINGGTINVTGKQAEISSSKNVNINGGTINIAEGSTLGIYGGNDQTPTTAQLGSAAILNIAGTLDTSLNGNGTINFNSNSGKITGDVNMTNGGIMNVGLNNAVIDGDATFNSGSMLKLEIADGGNGSLQAANITGKEGSKLALNITKKMEIGQTLEDVALLKGNVDNHFTNEISNNRYKVTSEDGKNFNITYENSASDVVADAGGSANNASTAEAWDTLVQSSTASANAKAVASALNDLSQNNEQAYVAALTAVAPEVAPMVQKTQTETANQVFGAVSTRLTGGSISTGGEGMSSGDNIFERAAMWVQGMFNKSKLDDTSKAKGFDADSAGVAFGAEKFVTDDTKVGIGYAYTNTDIDGFMRSTDVDTLTAILYGEYKPSNWYVNGIATYGWSDYSEDKSVAGVGVKADYDVETFGLQAMTGYDMQFKGLGFTPEVGLRYVHIKQDAYKDSADQKVSGNDSDILTGVIGAKVSKTWELSNGMNIKPEARIAATYDLFNDDVNSVVTLANGSAYAVEGEALDRFGMEFGAGVTAEVNDNVELSLGYEGKFRQDYQDHTGLINVKYKF